MRVVPDRIFRHVVFAMLMFPFSGPAADVPSGADLLAACRHSLINEFQGVEGALCIWYVTPCDCDYGKETEAPRVCLPASPAVEELAREVIERLTEQSELQTKEARAAAAIVLSKIYPCHD